VSDAKTFYDRYWRDEHIKKNPFDEHPGDWTDENFNYHFEFFKPYVAGKVLDFGCGEGQFANLIQPHCESVFGIDVSELALQKAMKEFSSIDFKRMPDNGHLPYEDKFFDTITALDVMEHILDIETVLEEINRILKPGGHLLIATSELTVLKTILISLRYLDDYFYPTTPHIRHFTRSNLTDLLAKKGFKRIAYKKNRTYFGFIPQGQMMVAQKSAGSPL